MDVQYTLYAQIDSKTKRIIVICLALFCVHLIHNVQLPNFTSCPILNLFFSNPGKISYIVKFCGNTKLTVKPLWGKGTKSESVPGRYEKGYIFFILLTFLTGIVRSLLFCYKIKLILKYKLLNRVLEVYNAKTTFTLARL